MMRRPPLRKKAAKPKGGKPNVDAYFAYVDDPHNGHCEISFYLGICVEPMGVHSTHRIGLEFRPEPGAHHIFSVSGQRIHERSNLIRISPVAHRLVHNGVNFEPQYIRLLCIAAKIKKRIALNDPAEFGLAVMKKVAGGNGIEGWLQAHEFRESWLESIRREAISDIEKFAVTEY